MIIFKKRKENIRPLTNIISLLLKNSNPKFLEIISQQSKMILTFLQKGKQIEKALQSLILFFKSSEDLLKKHFSGFIDLLANSDNRFLFQTGLNFLNHQLYHSNLKNESFKNFIRSKLSDKILEIVKKCEGKNIGSKKLVVFRKNMMGFFENDETKRGELEPLFEKLIVKK